MTPFRRRPRDRWEFVQSDDALWGWRFLDNVFTPPVVTLSSKRYARLDDCMLNAKQHGYAGWCSDWQALWGGIFFHSPMNHVAGTTKVRVRVRH